MGDDLEHFFTDLSEQELIEACGTLTEFEEACAEVEVFSEHEEAVSRVVIILAEVSLVLLVGITYFLSTRDFMSKVSVYAPHSTFMIILGLILGAIFGPISDAIGEHIFTFENEFFFAVLLPPIILAAGFSVRKDHFFHNFGSILVLAFIGTAVSTGVIGGLLYVVGNVSGVYALKDPNDCFILGSLISAVDPIATVVVLKSLGVDPHLYVLIFGESVLNDAVAIVINRVFVAAKLGGNPSPGSIIGSVIGNAVGSVAIGLFFGFLGAYIHRKSRLYDYPTLEIAFFFLIAFIPYEIAELSHLSGIMSILFTGIVADYYTSYNLSHHGAAACREMVEVLAFTAESFVFVYLGMTPFTYPDHNLQPAFIGFLLLFCLIGRAFSVFPLGLILNCGRKHKIPGKHLLVIWFAGLRGPIAFALALASPEEERPVMVTSTLGIVILTTVVFGGATMPILSKLNLAGGAAGDGGVDGDGDEDSDVTEDKEKVNKQPGKPKVSNLDVYSIASSAHSYRPRKSIGTAISVQRVEFDNIELASSYGNATIDGRDHRKSLAKWDESHHWFAILHKKYLAPVFRASDMIGGHGEEHGHDDGVIEEGKSAGNFRGSQDLDGTEFDPKKRPAFLDAPNRKPGSSGGDVELVDLGEKKQNADDLNNVAEEDEQSPHEA